LFSKQREIIHNVLKEELLRARESWFWPLVLGMAIYAAVLLAL